MCVGEEEMGLCSCVPMCMMWLLAVTQWEMWLLVSDWLATPAIARHTLLNEWPLNKKAVAIDTPVDPKIWKLIHTLPVTEQLHTTSVQ